MKKNLIIAIALFILTIVLKLIVDLHLYHSGGTNNHIIGPIIVLASIGVSTYLAGWRSIFMWLFVFWAAFDSSWGLLTGNGFFYVGTTAKLDILQRSYPFVLWLKYLGAIGSTFFYGFWAKKVI